MSLLKPIYFLTLICFCISAEIYPKCCDSVSVFAKINETFTCKTDADLRLQIITNNTDYINRGEGNCIEIENGKLHLFNVTDEDTVLETQELNLEYFPKCCPFGYFYNSTVHACVRPQNKSSIDEKFFNETLVKVGLPDCKIIVDLKLSRGGFKKINGDLRLNQARYHEGFYCLDRDENDSFIARICKTDYGICESIKCVHKCCPDGQSFVNGSNCVNTYIRGLDLALLSEDIHNYNDKFAIVHGHSKPLYVMHKPRFDFHLDKNGEFVVREVDPDLKRNVTNFYKVHQQVYCIEHATKQTLRGEINNFMFFRTFPQEEIRIKYVYTRYAMAVSSVFLILTLIYYLVSNEKRTFFGKTLICYCLAAFLNYSLLCYLAYDVRPSLNACTILAFIVVYCLQAGFTWLNIMCIDIYLTFGSPKSFSNLQHRNKELKRFMLYCLYGWGFPLVLTAILLIFYHEQVLPPSIEVTVDSKRCFLFKGGHYYGKILFIWFYITLLELCNIVLFIKTVVYCLKVKREISKMNDTHTLKGEKNQKFNNFKDRFGLLIKLFLIMGVSYLFEVASIFYDFKQNPTMALIELVWDTFNSLQGVFIFFIFVFKKRNLMKFREHLGIPKFRKCSLISSTATQIITLPPAAK